MNIKKQMYTRISCVKRMYYTFFIFIVFGILVIRGSLGPIHDFRRCGPINANGPATPVSSFAGGRIGLVLLQMHHPKKRQ